MDWSRVMMKMATRADSVKPEMRLTGPDKTWARKKSKKWFQLWVLILGEDGDGDAIHLAEMTKENLRAEGMEWADICKEVSNWEPINQT